MDKPEKIVLIVTTEWPGHDGQRTDKVELDPDQWARLTPDERNVVVVRHDELNRSKRITLTELGEAWATAQRKRDRVLAEAVAAAEAELAPARARIAAAYAAYEVDAIRERLDRARQADDYTQTDEYEAAVKAAQAAGLFPIRSIDVAA